MSLLPIITLENKNRLLLFLLLILHVILSLVLKFTAWPEMLTYPWLILNGYQFYGDIIHPYLPLLPYFLSICYQILGLSITTLRFITIMSFLSADVIIFYLTKRLYNIKFAFISVLIYILLQLLFEGNGLWFDLASVPLILLAAYIMTDKNKINKKNKILACFIIGIAILIKHTNIVFFIPVVMKFHRQIKQLLLLFLITLIPLILVVLFYIKTSEFSQFLYWGLIHPLFIHSTIPGFLLLPNKLQLITIIIIFSPVIFAWQKKSPLLLWFFLSLIFAIPRFAFFHLQHSAAFISLLIPQILIKWRRSNFHLIVYILVIGIIFTRFALKEFGKPVRFFDPETLKIRQEISNLFINEPVFFLNVPSQYFVMTNIRPMKPWADTFPWYLEIAGVQENLIVNLEKVNYVLYAPFRNNGKYEIGAYKPELITDYIYNNFVFNKNINNSLQLLGRKI